MVPSESDRLCWDYGFLLSLILAWRSNSVEEGAALDKAGSPRPAV
jgi:hypothetical protein